MIGRLNHVAIAVPDLEAARALYRDTLGAKVSEPVDMPAHGVTTVFIELKNAKIELLHPLGDDSPIRGFFSLSSALRQTRSSNLSNRPRARGCWFSGGISCWRANSSNRPW